MLTVARISSVVAVSTALVGAVALPATAADSDTTVTLTVAGGTLAISAPASAGFGTVTPGLPATVLLQDVNVTDTRAGTAGWVAQVASTDFLGTVPTNSIPADAALYTPAVAIPTGVVVVTPGLAATLSTTPQPAQTATAVTGNNSATWAADLLVNVPSTTLADTYTATLTYSVL